MNPTSKRVLQIEDNPENRYLATLLLNAEGFEVDAAENGADGLAAAEQNEYAFVLLDLQLPDIDGFEVAKRIRKPTSKGGVPIIAVSAFALPIHRRRAMAAGCSSYLEKPIDADAFVAQLRCLAGIPA